MKITQTGGGATWEPETDEEQAAISHVQAHVPFFAGAVPSVIYGFIAGIEWGRAHPLTGDDGDASYPFTEGDAEPLPEAGGDDSAATVAEVSALIDGDPWRPTS